MSTRRQLLVLALGFVGCGDVSTADPTPPLAPDAGPAESPTDTPPSPPPPPPVDEVEAPWTPPLEQGDVTFPYTAYKCGYATRQVSTNKPTALFHDAAAGAAPTPRNLHLTIAGNAASSVVIQWSTDDATRQTEVRFGHAPDKLDKVARGFSFASGSRRQHEVHLCGQKAGKTLYYDAGGPAARSKVHKLTTAPDAPTPVTLLVVGDTRNTPSALGGMTAAALARGPTAMLLSGDAVATGSSQTQWDDLFDAAPDLFAELPGIWAHGNHEGLSELYFQQFALPDHGGPTQIEQWFATTYGPVRVVVLNDTVSSTSQITGAEKQFLEATLKAVDRTQTPFVATMHHKPLYTTSNAHASDLSLRAAWGPLMAQYHVNLDIAGHVHSYESTHPIQAGTTTVTTDAAGTRFFNFGGGGAPLYGFSTTQAWIKARESTRGFAILDVTKTSMQWTAFRDDGSTIETISMPPN